MRDPLLDAAQGDVLELAHARDVLLDGLQCLRGLVEADTRRHHGDHGADGGLDVVYRYGPSGADDLGGKTWALVTATGLKGYKTYPKDDIVVVVHRLAE